MTGKYYLFFALLLSITFLSCDKKLDIAPENTLVDKEVFKTEKGAEQALSEVYYNFLKAVTNGFSYAYADFTTPLLNSTPNFNSYVSGEVIPTDFYVISSWSTFFTAINSANNVIAKTPHLGQFQEELKSQFVAEALTIRAFCYLDLLCMFGEGALSGKANGLGLPLQLTPFEGYNTGEIIPRSSNEAVFNQIIKDITDAIPDLPDRFTEQSKMRARVTKGVAQALLSRVYLFKGDFANAAIAAKAVIDMSPQIYDIMPDVRSVFPSNPSGASFVLSKEYVFGFPVSQMAGTFSTVNNNIGSTYFFKRSYWVNSEFLDEFEDGDSRNINLLWKGDTIYNTNMLSEKTTFKFNNSNGRDNVPIIRFPEVLLTRAEALAKTQGINDESIDILNQIRNRSVSGALPYHSSDFQNVEELITEILNQRKFELAFEGLHRYDLIRNNMPLKDPDISESKKVLPIPQSEIDISKGILVQNPEF